MAWTKINRFGLIIFLSKTRQVNQFDMQMEKVCSLRISNLKANKTELAKMLADINPIKVAWSLQAYLLYTVQGTNII